MKYRKRKEKDGHTTTSKFQRDQRIRHENKNECRRIKNGPDLALGMLHFVESRIFTLEAMVH
jgi:hypothetical protein